MRKRQWTERLFWPLSKSWIDKVMGRKRTIWQKILLGGCLVLSWAIAKCTSGDAEQKYGVWKRPEVEI